MVALCVFCDLLTPSPTNLTFSLSHAHTPHQSNLTFCCLLHTEIAFVSSYAPLYPSLAASPLTHHHL